MGQDCVRTADHREAARKMCWVSATDGRALRSQTGSAAHQLSETRA
jgi:hypothetical protein